MRLALVGPTASGKTEAAVDIAERLGAEIISCDSMLLYRGMDIGTAKPTPADRARVPHHGIDLWEPTQASSVAAYQAAALGAAEVIERAGRRVLFVGGSGLYYRAVVDRLEFPATFPETRRLLETEALVLEPADLWARVDALDPDAAWKIEPGNVRRSIRALEVIASTGRTFSSYAAEWDAFHPGAALLAGVTVPSEVLRDRIERRVATMIDRGLVDEVRNLIEAGSGPWLTASQAIGYAEVARYLAGEWTLDDAQAATVKRTRALARRQMAWFRRDPRIRWFTAPEGAGAIVDELTEYLGG